MRGVPDLALKTQQSLDQQAHLNKAQIDFNELNSKFYKTREKKRKDNKSLNRV